MKKYVMLFKENRNDSNLYIQMDDSYNIDTDCLEIADNKNSSIPISGDVGELFFELLQEKNNGFVKYTELWKKGVYNNISLSKNLYRFRKNNKIIANWEFRELFNSAIVKSEKNNGYRLNCSFEYVSVDDTPWAESADYNNVQSTVDKEELDHIYNRLINQKSRGRFLKGKMVEMIAKSDNITETPYDIKKDNIKGDNKLIKQTEAFLALKVVADIKKEEELSNILNIIRKDTIPERWHVLVNKDNGILGYWVFVPIRDKVYDEIIKGNKYEIQLTALDTLNNLSQENELQEDEFQEKGYSGYMLLFGSPDQYAHYRLDDVYSSWIKYITEQSSKRIFFKRIAIMLSTLSGKEFMREKGMKDVSDYDGCLGGKLLTYDFTHIGNIDYFKGKAEYEELVKNYTEFYKEEGSK